MGNTNNTPENGDENKSIPNNENIDNNVENVEGNLVDPSALNIGQQMMKNTQLYKQITSQKRGQFMNSGINEGLGRVKFELKYDVNGESLVIKLLEGDGLHCYSTLHSNLYSYVEISLERKKFRTMNGVKNPDKPEYLTGSDLEQQNKNRLKMQKYLKFKKKNAKSNEDAKEAMREQEFLDRQYLPTMRSSICCSSLSPVWHDVFVYNNIINSDLNDLLLKFKVIDLGYSTCIKPISKDGCLQIGEFVYDLSKIHKPLTKEVTDINDKDSSVIKDNPTRIPVEKLQFQMVKPEDFDISPARKISNISDVRNKLKAPSIEDLEAFEEQLEVDENFAFPTIENERGISFIEKWLDANEKMGFWPKMNMENGGLLNDEQLKSILLKERENDPKPELDVDNDIDVRDGVSVRSRTLYHKQKMKKPDPDPVIFNAKSILRKSVVKSPEMKSGKEKILQLPEKKCLVEKHLPKDERPKVFRYVGGWKYLTVNENQSNNCGEIEIGLTYNPEYNQILFQVIQARNIRAETAETMPIYVEFQARLRKYVTTNSDPKLVLTENDIEFNEKPKVKGKKIKALAHHNHEHIHSTDSLTKVMKTETRMYTYDPVWNKGFIIDVGKNVIKNIVFDLHVMTENRLIGCMRLFDNKLNPIMEDQWNTMMRKTRFPSVKWYPISL